MNGKEKLEKKSPSPVKKSLEPKKVASPGWTCWECDRLFTQRDVYISHVRKEHGKVRVETTRLALRRSPGLTGLQDVGTWLGSVSH